MTHDVLVPLEGLRASDRVLPLALSLARANGSAIHLVRVVDAPTGGVSARAGAIGVGQALADMHATAEREVTDLATQLHAATGVDVATHVRSSADVPGALLEHARAADTAVTVMATRARGGAARAVLGSVADRVMRESPSPVVLVPPSAARGDAPVTVRRVLVPLDGSPLGGQVLEHLRSLRLGDDVTFILLEVVPPATLADTRAPGAAGDPGGVRREVMAAEARLARAAVPLQERGFKVEGRVVAAERVATAIQSAAEGEHADLIAMATHGHGGLRRMLLGSVADQVVRESDVPVLLVTPTGAG